MYYSGHLLISSTKDKQFCGTGVLKLVIKVSLSVTTGSNEILRLYGKFEVSQE